VRFEEETETKQYAPWRTAGAHIVQFVATTCRAVVRLLNL